MTDLFRPLVLALVFVAGLTLGAILADVATGAVTLRIMEVQGGEFERQLFTSKCDDALARRRLLVEESTKVVTMPASSQAMAAFAVNRDRLERVDREREIAESDVITWCQGLTP